jgi:hypothetical protein
MNNEFVPYDIALAMKEIGFDEPCAGTYHNRGNGVKFTFGMLKYPKRNSQANTVSGTFIGEQGCYAPIFSQAFRWFREEHGLHNVPLGFTDNKGQVIYHIGKPTEEPYKKKDTYKTYEEAELACLKKLIKIVNQNKDENS